ADAPEAGGARPPLQPGEVVGVERDRDCLFGHYVYTICFKWPVVKVYAGTLNAADIRPARPDEQTQSTLDLFLIFVGANVVATTFQVGASLAASFTLGVTTALIAAGSIAGAALVAALAPLGSRLRVPSVIAVRPALGIT